LHKGTLSGLKAWRLGGSAAIILLGRVGLFALVGGVAACTSGPPAVDDRPDDAQLQAYRREKDAAFRSSRDSPIPDAARAAFPGLLYFPIDAQYRVPALLTETRANPPVLIQLQMSSAATERMRKVGTLGFTLDGAPLTLTAFAEEHSADMRRLFVPFTDLTSGSETYKHGRYLDLDRTPTGLYDLDFNRAYHPSCVYNSNYECPVPPKENHLAVAIRAGERLKAP
jgi:uncharacterized protein (DUF1684 family)